jgi:hypothetical protein
MVSRVLFNVACVALHLVSFRACHQPVSTAAPVQLQAWTYDD